MVAPANYFLSFVGAAILFSYGGVAIQSEHDLSLHRHNETAKKLIRSHLAHAHAHFHILFVTDCSAHQRWMAFNVFSSAQHAGQQDPITWLRSDCKASRAHDDGKAAAALYTHAKVVDIAAGKNGQDFNLGFGVPRALKTFLETSNTVSNDTVLALIEADMIFLSPLRVDNFKAQGLPMAGRKLIEKSNSPVSSKVGSAAHYLCCDDLGPPYILSVRDWHELIPLWTQAGEGKGWGADQVAFAEATHKAGIEFNVFDHLMVSAPSTTDEGWKLVEDALSTPAGDVCATKKFGMQPGVSHLPTFMHVVQPWTFNGGSSESWGFSKYQVPPGWKRAQQTDGILECGMPMFAEPPTSLLASAMDQTQKVNGWVVCTVLHSLNSMLLKYKQATCSKGFNQAMALKMKVPLEWTNLLLDGAIEGAPAGTDIEWLKRCAEGPDC